MMQQNAPNDVNGTSNTRLLPGLRRLAMWHPESGLIVSPYTRLLPSQVTWDMNNQEIETLLNPRILLDQHVYLAFYPQKGWDSGALFSTLASPNLSALIVETPESTPNAPSFILSDDVCQAWAELENFLLDISLYLFAEHNERQYLPDIDYPRWPRQCGYNVAHQSKVAAFQSLKQTLYAFRLLSAFVSFSLALWITQSEDHCFDRPFDKLMNRARNPILPIQLHYLRDSVVCKILPGLRPGGFLNPYETKWGRVMYRFCRFCVPLWMVWGHENVYKTIEPVDRSMKDVFFPPGHLIAQVKERQATFSWLVLPDSKGFAEAPIRTDLPPASTSSYFEHPLPDYAVVEDTAPLPDSTVATSWDPNPTWEVPNNADNADIVDRSSVVDTYRTAQRPGETWESFHARMELGIEKRKAVESEKEKQSREALELNARKNGYSKKTTVFVWEEDEVQHGFYRRTKVDKVDVRKEWYYCTEHQRFFWSHRKEWDLVPHLPRCPPGERVETPVEDLEIDHPRYNFLYSKSSYVKPNDSHHNELNVQLTGEHRFPFYSLSEYLKFCHGFATSLIDNWHPEYHDTSLPQKLYLVRDKFKFALRRLGYGERTMQQVPTNDEELTSIVNFQNICVAVHSKKIQFSHLPLTWDLSSSKWLVDGLLRLRVQTVKYERGDTNLYVIRPKTSSYDPSSWYVAVPSSTAVLLVFRKRWFTMQEIARAFLDLGIPFHTVEERIKEDLPVSSYRYRPHGLNVRLRGFTPTEADYNAHLQARDDVFKSPRARVLRLRGGIIGRLALESVPNVVILDGPSFCDEVIGTTDNVAFVNDFISNNDLEMVAGVYCVCLSGKENEFIHHSWWPKHGTWQKSGLLADQWLPNAEAFYVQRMKKFDKKVWDLKGATTWKESLKYDQAQLDRLYGGSEVLAKEFIRRYLA